MDKEIKNELLNARKLYKSKKFEESLEKFENLYNQNPDAFTRSFKISYAWAIYQACVKDSSDEDELFENVELITHLAPQFDLNRSNVCVYTLSVFKIIDYLNDENDYYTLLSWLDKINPDFLDEKRFTFNGIKYQSKKEKYYSRASKAYLKVNDFEMCIEVSKKALDEITTFTNNGDIWHKWRIAKSLKELDQNEESIVYLKEVLKVKNNWFVLKELAENFFILNDKKNALSYVSQAVLTNDPAAIKVNLYYLIYQLLKEDNPELALKHAELYLALKLENDSQITEDIEDLEIDEDNLDVKTLESEIKDYWSQFKYEGQELKYGTITKVFEHGKSGFITSDDYESFYFNTFEFKGDKSLIHEGLYVSFYTEESFDKSKNKESLNAVYISLA